MVRGYTTIEQSRKLAEILPLESADMSYTLDFDSGMYRISTTSYKGWIVPKYAESDKGFNQVLPCWSLAALLGVLPNYTLKSNKFYGKVALWCQGISVECDNPIDACYEMILKLHKLNLL